MASSNEFTLDGFLPYLLHQAAETSGRAFAAMYKEKFDISRTEWRILAHLGDETPLTAAHIAKRSNTDRTKISRAVFSLEERGWLTRAKDRQNRRQELLSLTPEGEKTYDALAKEATAHQKALAQRLGVANTRDLMKALATMRA